MAGRGLLRRLDDDRIAAGVDVVVGSEIEVLFPVDDRHIVRLAGVDVEEVVQFGRFEQFHPLLEGDVLGELSEVAGGIVHFIGLVLVDPRTGHRPWAAVQLRAENAEATAYNLVGFQTNLAWGEQARVFR
ncbi:MAG: FAD-dependent oxidoreductase, partial [Thermoguttaceae bacterium]|nr:FAD-dependent oxidoreductase [Thermoguttaceae bacterium]